MRLSAGEVESAEDSVAEVAVFGFRETGEVLRQLVLRRFGEFQELLQAVSGAVAVDAAVAAYGKSFDLFSKRKGYDLPAGKVTQGYYTIFRFFDSSIVRLGDKV